MTTPLKKHVSRELTLKLAGLPERKWIVTIAPAGITARKKGASKGKFMGWHELLGVVLIHGQTRES